MKKFLNILMRFHPNKELPKESAIWTVVAIALMGFSLWIAFTANWQTEGFCQAGYKDGKLVEVIEVSKACRLSIVPHITSLICAILIYSSLLVRRFVRPDWNPWAFLLFAADVFFVAALIESFLPAKEVCLFQKFGFELLTFSPLKLLVFVIFMSWLGMRALSGFSFILLIFAFWSRTQELDVALGFWGCAFLACGFLSFVVQFCRLPYMVPEGGLRAAFRQDFGWVADQIHQNLMASVVATEKVAVAAVSAAGPVVVSAVNNVVGGESAKPQIREAVKV